MVLFPENTEIDHQDEKYPDQEDKEKFYFS
jgi:hypothetical protein